MPSSFLAGLAGGLNGFAGVMQQRDAQKQKEMQNKVLFERQKALETLRAQNNRDNAQFSNDLGAEQRGIVNQQNQDRLDNTKEQQSVLNSQFNRRMEDTERRTDIQESNSINDQKRLNMKGIEKTGVTSKQREDAYKFAMNTVNKDEDLVESILLNKLPSGAKKADVVTYLEQQYLRRSSGAPEEQSVEQQIAIVQGAIDNAKSPKEKQSILKQAEAKFPGISEVLVIPKDKSSSKSTVKKGIVFNSPREIFKSAGRTFRLGEPGVNDETGWGEDDEDY